MKKFVFFLFILLFCQFSLSNAQCATYVQTQREIQIINDDIELERDTQYDNYKQADATLQFLYYPVGSNYSAIFEEKPSFNTQCEIEDIEYNSTYYRVLHVSNLESDVSTIQFKTSYQTMDLSFGAIFSFQDVLNAQNLTIRLGLTDTGFEEYQLIFTIDSAKVAVKLRAHSTFSDKFSIYTDALDVYDNQRIYVLRYNHTGTTYLSLYVDSDYSGIVFAEYLGFTPTDLYIINQNNVYSDYYFHAFTANFNPQPNKGLTNQPAYDYIDATDIIPSNEYIAKRSVFNQDVLEFENPNNEAYELTESATFRNPNTHEAVITDALYFSDVTQNISWNYDSLEINDVLYINIFKESLEDYYTEMNVLIGNNINYIEFNVRVDEIQISRYDFNIKTSIDNISLTKEPQNFILAITRLTIDKISLGLLGKYDTVTILPPIEQYDFTSTLNNFIIVKAKFSYVPIAFYVSRVGIVSFSDLTSIFEGDFGISLYESTDPIDFEFSRPTYPNHYASNYRIPKIEFELINVEYNAFIVSEVYSFSFNYNNEEYIFNNVKLIEDPHIYDTNVFEYTLHSDLAAFIVSDESIIAANYTMNATFTFLYQISEIPDEFLESMVLAIMPLLMYLIIPVLFYSRLGKKGAMFGIILSVFVNMFAGTIPLFYNIIILIVSIVLVIAMLKGNKNSEVDN